MNLTQQIELMILGTIATGIVSIIIMLWSNRLTLKKSIDDKHAENVSKFNQLLVDRQYHPPHTHTEKDGPLYAEGITTTPIKINGKG